MSELASTLPWIAASVIILVALVIGMGLALHFQTRLPRIAQPAIGLLQTLIPPIGLFLAGRNLAVKNLDFFQSINPQGAAAWVQRIGTTLIVSIAIAVIVVKLLDRNDRNRPPLGGRMLIVAFLVYYVTNVLLNAYFGTVPGIIAPYLYTAIVAVALMMTRDQGSTDLLVAFRWGLTVLMVVSLVMIPIQPTLVLQPNSPEVRLPFVTFRLFGMGSGPNSIGPLAATLILIAIHVPFRSRVLQLVSLTSAFAVFVLAQSQTAWIAMAVIMPAYLGYRWVTNEEGGRQRRLSPTMLLGFAGLALAGLFAASLFVVDWPQVLGTVAEFAGLGGDGLTNRSISGRGAIWSVAIDTFRENPLFGYGLTAWDSTFRSKLNMPFAFHAHNQLMQSLSVAGLVGVAGLLFYVGMLCYYSLRYARLTRGLGPALLVLILVRCISEVPLDVLVMLTGDVTTHLALLMVLAGAAAFESRHVRATSRIPTGGGFDWRTSPGGRTLAPARSIAVDPAASDEEVVGAILRYGGRDRGPGGVRAPGQFGFDGSTNSPHPRGAGSASSGAARGRDHGGPMPGRAPAEGSAASAPGTGTRAGPTSPLTPPYPADGPSARPDDREPGRRGDGRIEPRISDD